MPKYLLQVSYSLDGIRGVKAEGGSARRKAAESAVKSVGGSLDCFYFAFGEADVVVIADFPDNTAAAASAIAIGAAGGARTRTLSLLSAEEIDDATRREVSYRPPGS
jgi:uncharacterized protein with GYD domain